jgi:hypothetical protein
MDKGLNKYQVSVNTRRALRPWLAVSVVSSLMTLRVLALDPGLPPGSNFDLSHWYLGLPVDSSGGTNGNSASIPAAQLVAGYSNALYFYTGSDGAMLFWAPVTGATTSGSDYPRSELREQLSPPSNSSNWFAFGTHILDAQCKVLQVPTTKKVIIGQIHGYTGDARPVLKLQYNNGSLEALVKTNSSFDGDKKWTFSSVALSNNINYQIKLVDGLLSVTVNGATQSTNIFLHDSDWDTNSMYFKAGSYCQDNDGPTNEGARVAFYSLTRSHAPSITNQPGSSSVVVGSNTAFSVSAGGNGRLRYQWRFNETNDITSATNASYVLTNVQTGNAGGYSVRVADSLGAVTSVIATLTVLVPPEIITDPSNKTVIVGNDAAFAITATGSTPLSYQWYFNTNTLLPGATNATLIVSNAGVSDAGVYSAFVTNPAGSALSGYAALAVNRHPVPGTYSTVTGQEIPVSTSVAHLLAVATDPDGDAVNISNVNPASVGGGTVWLTNGLVWYAPGTGFTGNDQWTYELTDARGAATNGIVTVNVISADAITLNAIGQAVLEDGSFVASFEGVPGLRYVVDRATNISGLWELGFTNLTAGTNGIFELNDPDASQPQRYYRTHYP